MQAVEGVGDQDEHYPRHEPIVAFLLDGIRADALGAHGGVDAYTGFDRGEAPMSRSRPHLAE